MSKVREIAVLDANGDELLVYEFHDRRFIRKVRLLKLDTGETVKATSNGYFVVGPLVSA